jgi:hypothetical protein
MEYLEKENRPVTLEGFVRSYIKNAIIEFYSEKEPVSLNDWENGLRKRVSLDTGLSEEQICILHHPFHWVFFSKDSKEISPFEIGGGRGRDSNLYVSLKEKPVSEKLDRLAKYIYLEYGRKYLRTKVDNANIPLL